MFRLGLRLAWFLPVFSLASASTDPVADKRCIDSLGPGYEAQLDSAGNAIQCVKITTEDNCFPNWLNPNTGKYECW